MNHYKTYMERQEISPKTHERLLALREGGPGAEGRRPARRWTKLAALAACFVLAAGLVSVEEADWQALVAAFRPDAVRELHSSPGGWGSGSAQAAGSAAGAEGELNIFSTLPEIHYRDAASGMELAASIALPDGAFEMELTHADLLKLFFGPQGEPGEDYPTIPTVPEWDGELPWMLYWEGYDLHGRVIYDGEGRMFWLLLFGEHPNGHTFALELAPGRLPPTCLAQPDQEASQVNGVAVNAWRRAYDRNGDDVIDHVCGSEFMAGDIGVRFENVGSEFMDDYGGLTDLGMGGAAQFNALFVDYALEEGLYVGHLLQNDRIPAWREASFESLTQAREEEGFTPYLPAEDISGYGDFYSHLSYQEGNSNMLFVRWSRGYDDVEVCVYLPEGEPRREEPVDAANPASYDTRLYEIPWAETVPAEYSQNFYRPTFRAEDMSLAIVEARGTGKDTGGMAYRFNVLHRDGTLVQYSCSGLTAGEVWSLVKPTLPQLEKS